MALLVAMSQKRVCMGVAMVVFASRRRALAPFQKEERVRMKDPLGTALQKCVREHPEVREILEKFVISSAQYEHALRAVASTIRSSPRPLQMATRSGVPWRPVRG